MFSDYVAKVAMFLGTAAALLFVNEMCFAAQGTGRVSVYHLNLGFPGRGACIQTVPPLPGTWACVYSTTNNFLYHELNDLFRDAYIGQKTCLVDFDLNNGNSVNFAECR
jgi:hypothetical protein